VLQPDHDRVRERLAGFLKGVVVGEDARRGALGYQILIVAMVELNS